LRKYLLCNQGDGKGCLVREQAAFPSGGGATSTGACSKAAGCAREPIVQSRKSENDSPVSKRLARHTRHWLGEARRKLFQKILSGHGTRRRACHHVLIRQPSATAVAPPPNSATRQNAHNAGFSVRTNRGIPRSVALFGASALKGMTDRSASIPRVIPPWYSCPSRGACSA
jgi:hypothetical protein